MTIKRFPIRVFPVQVMDIKTTYTRLRENMADTFEPIFQQAVQLGGEIGVEPSCPRVVARQQHRGNAPAAGVREHYLRNVAIPFMDHICSELESQFSGTKFIKVLT